MIKGILTKFQPLKTGEVSVLITTTKEYLHELVDLQDKEISIEAIQENLPLGVNKSELLASIEHHMAVIKQMLIIAFPEEYGIGGKP